MKTYKMHGDGVVTGRNPKEITENLRAASFDPGVDLEDFMKRTAEACKLYNKATIRTDSFDNFVADLIQFKYLMEE